MRRMGWVLLALTVGGCTSTRMMQREGCWVRQTRSGFGSMKEEIGPCARPQPAWSQDRLMRLVQECMAHDDYRWQSRALAAWNRGEALPARESEADVLESCMAQARGVLATEKEAVEKRLSEVTQERDALRASVEQDREAFRANLDKERDAFTSRLEKEREAFNARMDKERDTLLGSVEQNNSRLHDSNNRLADALGEAAKKPAPSAVATATATGEGKANTQNDSTNRSDSSAQSRRSTDSRQDSRRTVPAPRPTVASAPERAVEEPAPAPACAQPVLATQQPEQAKVFVPVPPGLPGATQ